MTKNVFNIAWKNARSIQYGNGKSETRARVLYPTLAHGNDRNELRQVDLRMQAKRVNVERSKVLN